jgi:hypothetical protein
LRRGDCVTLAGARFRYGAFDSNADASAASTHKCDPLSQLDIQLQAVDF